MIMADDQLSAVFLVLPVRIELTTSPLPRECSTTELRQHSRPEAVRLRCFGRNRRDPCHRGGVAASGCPLRITGAPIGARIRPSRAPPKRKDDGASAAAQSSGQGDLLLPLQPQPPNADDEPQ